MVARRRPVVLVFVVFFTLTVFDGLTHPPDHLVAEPLRQFTAAADIYFRGFAQMSDQRGPELGAFAEGVGGGDQGTVLGAEAQHHRVGGAQDAAAFGGRAFLGQGDGGDDLVGDPLAEGRRQGFLAVLKEQGEQHRVRGQQAAEHQQEHPAADGVGQDTTAGHAPSTSGVNM